MYNGGESAGQVQSGDWGLVREFYLIVMPSRRRIRKGSWSWMIVELEIRTFPCDFDAVFACDNFVSRLKCCAWFEVEEEVIWKMPRSHNIYKYKGTR